jgi:hypothetical protein
MLLRVCVNATSAGAEEANNSDGDNNSADDGRPQYFVRNSDSSATSGDDSSDDSSFDSSGAGAESAGDSPQGKSDVVQSRQDRRGTNANRAQVVQGIQIAELANRSDTRYMWWNRSDHVWWNITGGLHVHA